MRVPGRAEIADGLIGGSLSFLGGVVAGSIAYLATLRDADVGFWTVALGFGGVLALFGFVAEFVRCWISGPRFGLVLAYLKRTFAGQAGAGPSGPTSRSRRMVVAGVTAALVVTVFWIVRGLAGR